MFTGMMLHADGTELTQTFTHYVDMIQWFAATPGRNIHATFNTTELPTSAVFAGVMAWRAVCATV